jgi:hypothetical protein
VYVVHKSAFKDFRSFLVAQKKLNPASFVECIIKVPPPGSRISQVARTWFERRELEGRTNGRAKPAGAKLEEEKKMKEEDHGPHSKNGNNSKKPQKGALVDKVD